MNLRDGLATAGPSFRPRLKASGSGKGLVPDELVASPQFVLAVACGAGATVNLATLLGLPKMQLAVGFHDVEQDI